MQPVGGDDGLKCISYDFVESYMCFSEMKLYPVLLKFKERMTSMFCHLCKRKKNIGKCLSTKVYRFRGWGGGSVIKRACPSSMRT